MAGYLTPLASATAGIDFSRYSDLEIQKISVKRIHNSNSLDSFLNPVPGGLHDPALGAIRDLDINCTTCHLNANHCSGHCGHIELPVKCYHPDYVDIVLRLLRSKCIYCHQFRLPRTKIIRTYCALRLLQHGLIDEYAQFLKIGTRKMPKTPAKGGVGAATGGTQDSDDDDEEVDERRETFTRKTVARHKKRTRQDKFASVRNPAAIEKRREVLAEFLHDAMQQKRCATCKGITPGYRKDRKVKLFRQPLAQKAQAEMKGSNKTSINPLVLRQQQEAKRLQARKPHIGVKQLPNGVHDDEDIEMGEAEHELMELHGAEDIIAEIEAEAAQDEDDIIPESQAYMTPAEVHAALDLLFEKEPAMVQQLFGASREETETKADIFFVERVLVPPNKFRPLVKQGQSGGVLEAQQNGAFKNVITAANVLRQILIDMKKAKTDPSLPGRQHQDHLAAGVSLQEAVNLMIDSPPQPSNRRQEPGIKQILEKKEGLFRMNMMGKRVNFAARSVISPDPNLESNEIGVPLVFAKKLTYPEPVTSHNFETLSKAVINGMDKYPGAAAIENENGQVLSLRRKDLEQRKALAKQLMTVTAPGCRGETGKKVYRHLQTGDVVIMNRQPTLHKPSMMGHRARVLRNEKTIRMHYANCNTYNADFDGDEMNMHFPQNENARAEALQVADTDHQYLSATAGKPLRGLIQDHISMGVQFTSRDTFFSREQYQQLLYNCLRPEDYNTVFDKIQMVAPAILKPRPLWTGKQVITTILKNIVSDRFRGINLTSKSSTPAEQWGESTNKDPAKWDVTNTTITFRDTEQVVIFKDGEHLCGILDKSQIGPSAGGLVHSVHELFGHIVAGKLLSVLGRMLTRFLNQRAWSCGVEDLYLTKEGDKKRREELDRAAKIGNDTSAEYVSLKSADLKQDDSRLSARLEDVLRNDDQLNSLDQLYKSKVKSITDSVTATCMPNALQKPFPRNHMQAMTISGAKGSSVNANLISCNLGQQVLEGRRVPTMVSGKTLPSFRAFETHPVAGGYVSGRFLTGIKPQEYFFHAMSGREGLIDTAVKTSKSGYLQRCVVKGLEGAKTEYDGSVREASTGSLVQFLYGEDGLEVTKQKHLKEFAFQLENHHTVSASTKIAEVMETLLSRNVSDQQKELLKSLRKGKKVDPLTTTYPPSNYFGSTSESFASALAKYLKDDPDKLIKDKRTNPNGLVSKKTFQALMELKFMKSVVDPGEAVGVVAAQSIGEPSTQMTLNTFHLAGHSAKNVTLGIPRLREIIMTATRNIMTPTMSIKPIEELSIEDGERFAKSISRLSLAHVIDKLSVTERSGGKGYENEKFFDIRFDLYPSSEYTEEYAIQVDDVKEALDKRFLPRLDAMIKKELRKKEKEASMSEATAAMPEIGTSVGRSEEARPTGERTAQREGGEDDIDEDADPDDAKDMAARARREDDHDEPDEEERAIVDDESDQGSDDDETIAEKGRKARSKNLPEDLVREESPVDSGYDTAEEESAKALENKIQAEHPHVKNFRFSESKGNSCRIVLSYSIETPKLLLLPIVEACAHASVIQSIPGLGICTLFMEEVNGPDGKPVKIKNAETGKEEPQKEPVITTEGVNLLAVMDYQDIINPHSVYTNSVHDMLKFYGVEAARATIVREIDAVFKGHGISVDNRHLNLIADAMTQSGGYKAFNRHGIVKEGGSVLAKMSFETVVGILKDAALYGEGDPLLGPSARIVAGRRGNVGTGSFDVIMPVS